MVAKTYFLLAAMWSFVALLHSGVAVIYFTEQKTLPAVLFCVSTSIYLCLVGGCLFVARSYKRRDT